MTRSRRSLRERFFDQIMPEPNSGCWLWIGARGRRGYGRIGSGGRGGKNLSAHRVSLELHDIAVPRDKHVLHKCDNPCCVNPDHLFVGTQKDNMRDMRAKGRAYPSDILGERLRGRKKRPEQIQRGEDHWNHGSRKARCKHGHTLDGDNVVIGSDGHRRCRTCRNERSRIRQNQLYATNPEYRRKKIERTRKYRIKETKDA